MGTEMNHFDEKGNAVMVDVSGKEPTFRTAIAEGKIQVSKEIMDAVTGHTVKKGDVFVVHRLYCIYTHPKRRCHDFHKSQHLTLEKSKTLF